MNSLKKFDEDQVFKNKETQNLEQRSIDSHNATLQDLGFGPEEEDEMQGLQNFCNYDYYQII